MAGPPTAAWSEASVRYSGESLPNGATITLGLKSAPGLAWDIVDVAEILRDNLRRLVTSTVALDEVEFKQGPEATGPTFVYPLGTTGSVSGFANQPQVCLLVRKVVSGTSGRFAGRFYSPAAPQAWVSSGGVVGGAGDAQAALNDLFDELTSVGADPVVFSSVGGDPRPVSSLVLTGRVATQRRRVRR